MGFLSFKFRRLALMALLLSILSLLSILIIVPPPDLSLETELVRKIASLSVQVEYVEMVNKARKKDLFSLSSILNGSNWSSPLFPLSLPSIFDFLPHTLSSPSNSFTPSLLVSQSRTSVSIVLGIPTVKRTHQSYLLSTLKSIMDNMSDIERNDTLIIIFIAEYNDSNYVSLTAESIKTTFPSEVSSGLLEILAPSSHYYPNMSALRQTLGDDPERVAWRTKQNLDYAYLMMYASLRGLFYVQLEDDILTKSGFISTMKNYALDKIAANDPWFLIDFCQLGFIGKLFKSSSLPILVTFFHMFYNDKPVDWLLDNAIQTKVCKLDHDTKMCKKEKGKLWVHYKPSLFQHIGTHSSLKGKVQELKDKQFGKISLFVPHKNPPAEIETEIKHYKQYSLIRAYRGETFYWGLVPQIGDTIIFHLNSPVTLKALKFVSGNVEHPSDRFMNTTVELYPEDNNGTWIVVGMFDNNGLFESKDCSKWGSIAKVRLHVHSSSENWAILSEIFLQT